MSWTIRRFAVLLMLLGAAGCGASLLELSRRGDLQAVQQALQRGSNVNARTVQGHSPLSLAAREGHPDVVRALIQAGADPDAVAWSLSTHPRPRAFRHQGSELTRERFVNADSSGPQSRFMAERTEIDVDWMLKDGKTPLMLAAERGHLDVVKALVDNGANLHLTSGGSWTLDRKPDRESFNFPAHPRVPQARDPGGVSGHFLQYSRYYGHEFYGSGDYVEPDDASGSKPAIGYDAYPRRFHDSPDSKTALDLANDNGHIDIVDFLRKAGARKRKASSK
jgi:ankyrin repeat protein